jgi:CvfB-like winged helix domain
MRCPFERHGRPILRLSGGNQPQQHRVACSTMLFRRGHPSAVGWEQHHRLFATQQEPDEDTTAAATPNISGFQRGMLVIVEVMKFGPLGASVDVVAKSHDPNDVVPASADALGQGLIDQQEISYYRSSRDGLDVVLGEVLKGYVTSVRPVDGKLSIGLRPFGGRGKATEIGARIMERLKAEGRIPVGDRSEPGDIEREFPGASKLAFKKAVAALYKEGKVQPGPFSIAPYGVTKDDPPRRKS